MITSIRKTPSAQHLLSGLFVLGVFLLSAPYIATASTNKYFRESVAPEELKEQFNRKKVGLTAQPIKILILPGHEPDYGGAEFRLFKERDWNVELAEQLFAYLENDRTFDVVLARTKEKWNGHLARFLEKNEQDIQEFVEYQKELTNRLLEKGEIVFPGVVKHGDATARVAQLLYGVNAWANEEDFDIVLSIHFNDTAGRDLARGWPSGFAIYVPDPQFSNGRASYALAEPVFERLKQWYPVSNLKQEADGIVFNEKLIAVGANNTLDAATVLIEYGYIYERGYEDELLRERMIRDYALQTYLGIQDFFVNRKNIDMPESILIQEIPDFFLPLSPSPDRSEAVLSLQAMLREAGVFPHPDDNFNDCPLDGVYGACTVRAVQYFQESQGLEPDGVVGQETYERLVEEIQ